MNQKKSLREIASELNTHHKKVSRALKYHGIEVRDQSEAQKNALLAGKAVLPTEGRKRTSAEKDRISEGMRKSWASAPDAAREKQADRLRKRWEELPPEERQEILASAARGNLKASKEGSKLERRLTASLKAEGIDARHHAQFVIANAQMHVDILLPGLMVAIEVDGPSHFLPIWGEEKLEKSLASDKLKNGLLINAGYKVLRIQHPLKALSRHHLNTSVKRVLTYVDKLETQSGLTTISTE